MERERIDLSGIWRFQADPAVEGEELGWAQPALDDALWREVWVPSCWDVAMPSLADYQGHGWYRRWLDVPADWRGGRITLQFFGVHDHARVWCNGCRVGEHGDGFLGFEVDITDHVRPGEPALVAVRSDNLRIAGEVPGLERGWRAFGGFQRRVELCSSDMLRLEDLQITATAAAAGGQLAVHVAVTNGRPEETRCSLRIRVLDHEGEAIALFAGDERRLRPGGCSTWTLDGHVPGARLWSPVSPTLYSVEAMLCSGQEVVDVRSLRTGFRTIEVRGASLWLNGERLTLTGLNRHEDSAQAGMAEDPGTLRGDIQAMRDAGANFLRLCHYPHHPDELDLCDELGLLAMGEIPLYWWRGEGEGNAHSEHKLVAAERQLRGMIARDRHHPSVILWSVSNETEEQRAEVRQGNDRLLEVSHRLDPSRLAVHVSNHWRDAPHFWRDDVICVNGYPTLDRRLAGQGFDPAHGAAWWREGLDALHAQYPDKPILVSEFGYPALEGSRGGALSEDEQARAIQAELEGMEAPWVCGSTLWCWADHAWPANVFTYLHGLAISPYGVITRDRRAKLALAGVRQAFSARQELVQRAPAAPTAGAAGDALYMIRASLEGIPDCPFPAGFGIRGMRPDEAGLWLDIERDAEPYFALDDGLFQRVFGSNLMATRWRSYLVTDARGIAVGTVSAWQDPDYLGEPWGQVHWLAVRPAYQRQGLARAALAYTLRQLARWHTRAYLGTQSRRVGAIRLYLDMGFVPDLRHPGARRAWESVSREIEHPALAAALSLGGAARP